MTDASPTLFTPPTQARRWRIVLHDGETRTVEAHSFRCEQGCLVLVLPVGAAAAFAPGQWHRIEQETAP